MMRRLVTNARAVLGTAALLSALVACTASAAGAQVRVRDLVVTLGGSVEGYTGDLPAVTVPFVDSTDHVVAAVGEVGLRGVISLTRSRTRSLELSFDGGMRQAAAMGFHRRDYAPREWVGRTSVGFTQSLGNWGSLSLRSDLSARAVRDRPPMPMFLQPGYSTAQGSAGILTRAFDGVSFDATVDVEYADYKALEAIPQLDLLDRSSSGVEVGARWGRGATMRIYGGFRWTEYGNQGSFEPEDPFRRDHTARVGVEWTYVGDVFAQLGVDGTVNRSNSNRPEYDAVGIRALLTAPLPAEFSLNLYALLTAKSYTSETAFFRLVPGEEADNASIVYLQLGRPIATNLDGAFRLGWTRAETDIGSAYYRRFGASVQFNYRPNGF